ncbi:hypothetical protein [Nocardia abscessus]|uniref:hypothetical protein n=1 Tax=Nocardia abscessus TaxID=120957 RepID=UPI0024564B5C|nr:hypothetical protein [Nocardia abscessus]
MATDNHLSALTKRLLESLKEHGSVDWRSPEDLGRLSFESMLRQGEETRTLASHGRIRLTGEGVDGSSAGLSDVGAVMTAFQRIATAFGASRQGEKDLGRDISRLIVQNTRLLLETAPSPGSIVLAVTPAMTALDEVGEPDGQHRLFSQDGDDDQVLDIAVADVIEIFSQGSEIGPDPDKSEFIRKLTVLGPRAASAVRDLSKTLSQAGFDAEIDWTQPGRATRSVEVAAHTARRIVDVVQRKKLDEQPVTIIGELLTVSAVEQWFVRDDRGQVFHIKLGDVSSEDIRGLAVGQRVRIDATLKVERSSGGATKMTYVLRTFRVEGESANE